MDDKCELNLGLEGHNVSLDTYISKLQQERRPATSHNQMSETRKTADTEPPAERIDMDKAQERIKELEQRVLGLGHDFG